MVLEVSDHVQLQCYFEPVAKCCHGRSVCESQRSPQGQEKQIREQGGTWVLEFVLRVCPQLLKDLPSGPQS